LLGQAFVLLPLTALGVHLLGVKRWQSALAKLTPFGATRNFHEKNGVRGRSTTPAGAIADEHSLRRRARVIARVMRIAAGHSFYRPNCLQQSLVLWCLLGRNRIASELRFGARKEAGQLKAHAWVECCGLALNEDPNVCQHYSVFEAVAPEVCPDAKV
jgi:hypothetical protein